MGAKYYWGMSGGQYIKVKWNTIHLFCYVDENADNYNYVSILVILR